MPFKPANYIPVIAGKNFGLEEMNNKTEDNEESEEIDGRGGAPCSHDDRKSNDVQHKPNDSSYEDSGDVTNSAIFAEMRTFRVEFHERLNDLHGTLELATVGVIPATAIDTDISSTNGESSSSSTNARDVVDDDDRRVVASGQLLNQNNDNVSDVSSHEAQDDSSTQLQESDSSVSGGMRSSLPSPYYQHHLDNMREVEEEDRSGDGVPLD